MAFSLMAYTANLKALQLGRDGVLTEDDIIGAWMASHGDCACGCGRSVAQNGQLDHIVPFGRGGLNTADNIQILTRSCNMRKGNQ